jgi:hypothetical protein
MNELIDEGRHESPAWCVDRGAGVICQQGHVGAAPDARHPNLSNSEDIPTLPNPDAPVSCPSASDSTGSLIHRANECEVAGRSAEDDWRIALHESGHVVTHLVLGDEICGVTIVPDAECAGRTWGPQGVRAAAVTSDYGTAKAHQWNADSLSEPGVSRNGDVRGVFSIVQAGVIAMMGGCAAEMLFLGDPPKYIFSDVPSANYIAGFVCRTKASVAAFIEHGYQESLALVEQHKTVVQAIAQALIDHPKRTLNGAEIDAVIAPALAAQAAADEHKRRADWIAVLENANTFTAELES